MRRRIQQSRKKLCSALARFGYDVYPSHANFVLARRAGRNLRAVYERLKERKILVRYFDVPELRDCLRITVGTPKEIATLLEQMKIMEV